MSYDYSSSTSEFLQRLSLMQPYGKVAQAALCAASLLAEHYEEKDGKRFSSIEIARQRNLSQPIVAKVLTVLSQSGVVVGAPGPGGGYVLARSPAKVSLLEVVEPFERMDPLVACPYGVNWCGNGPQCPLHHQLLQLQAQVEQFLHKTTLAGFKPPTTKRSASKKAN